MSRAAGTAYSISGDHYLSYADGDPDRLFSFTNHFAYADAQLWSAMCQRLRLLRADGRDAVRILDAGCGPGTWLRRLVAEARRLGFRKIDALGFDIAETQIAKARALARDFDPCLSFELRDLTDPLPEADRSVDLTLCLYCVLNHLPLDAVPGVFAELARVTRGSFITTVRAIGSTPTAFVDSIDHTRAFLQDNKQDRFVVELLDGQVLSFPSHLFCAQELRGLLEQDFVIDSLRGLDLFHSRFSPDPRWNPASLAEGEGLIGALAELEDRFAADPAFIDRANHILCIGHPKRRCRE